MNKSGFTLIELIIGGAILVATLLALLALFTACMNLHQSAQNFTIAINVAQAMIEVMHNDRDQQNPPVAGHTIMNIPGLPAPNTMVFDIFDDGTDPDGLSSNDLSWISVSVSWSEKGSRIIGEDNGAGAGIALDGWATGTEDVNGNNILDSPVQIITLLKR